MSVNPNQPDVLPQYVDIPGNGAAVSPAPTPVPVSAAAPVPENPDASVRPAGLRDGDCRPKVPDGEPQMVNESQVDDSRKTAPEPEFDSRGLPVPTWLRWLYLSATLVVVALFGLFLFSQAISSLALARTLPVWAQYLLLIPLAFCALAVLGVIVSLVWSWLRLRSFRQINLAAVEELRRRAESRQDAVEHYQTARRNLEQYIKDYVLVGREAGKLVAAGLSDTDMDALRRDGEYLLARQTDSRDWLNDFQRLYQRRLDETAARRVNIWALKAAGCVMASPLPLLDALLILGISLRMIRELCVIYRIRTGNTASMVLLVRAIRNAFIAGVAEDATDMAGEALGDHVSQILGEGAASAAGSSFARLIAPKLGEGAINALFMRRLGRLPFVCCNPCGPERNRYGCTKTQAPIGRALYSSSSCGSSRVKPPWVELRVLP